MSVRLGARKISPTRRSSNVRAGTTVKVLGSKVCGVSGMSVVEFMLSSFPSLFFEGWSVVESGVDAKLFFGRLMAATTAAPRRIILRRDKQLDLSSESGDIPDSASFVCVGMFIAISSVARGSEAEGLQIAVIKRIPFLLSRKLPRRYETVSQPQRRSPAMYVGRIYFVGHGHVFCKDGTWVVTRLV